MSGRLFQVDVGSLDSKQISQHFSLLLDELAITDDKVRSQWESEYTVAQKTSVLEHLQDDSKKNEVPLDFVTGLKKNAFEIEFLEDLLDKLSTSDEKWVDEFVEANGLLWLVEFIIVSFNEINSSVRQALSKGFDPSKLELILSCISQLVNESSEGLNKLLTVKGGFIHIANCLEYVSVEKKVTILEILSACCLESESSWGLVVDALNGFCLSRPKYFASMIDDDFINGDSFDFKIAYMMLINTLIVNGPDLLSRITIRERFMVFKGQDLITRELRIENVGDEEMTEQLQMYDEELENDFKEFTSTKASAIKSLQDGIDLIRPTWSQLRGTELKSIITKVLRTFLLFLDPKSREGIWNHMDNWNTHYASIVKEGKKNLSQSSFREVLVEVALKANPNEPLTSAAPSSPGRVKLPQESASASTATPASSSSSSSGSTPGKLSSTALPSGSSEKQSSSNSLPAPGKLAAPGPPPPAPSGPPPPPSSGGPPPPPGAPPPPGPPVMMGGPPPPPMMGGPPPPPMMGGPPLPPLPPGMGVPPPPGGPPPPPGMPMMGGPPLFPGLPPPPGPPPPPGMGFPPPPPGAPRPPGAPGLPPPLPGGPPPIPGMMFGASAGPVFPPRPAMTPWRWAPIPPRNIQGTVFKDLNPNAVELDESMIQDIFGMDNKKDEKKEDDKAKKKAEPVAQPKVLSQQRCTVLEIVVKRFDQPSGLIRDAILNGHFDRLSIQKLHELKSLFPPKSFDEDKKALSEYTGDPKELLPVESFMRDLILIPRIVGRLNVLIYSHEYGGTLTSARDNMTILLKAVQELKNPAVAKLLEISLALGNYLNSGGKQPKAPAVGFKLASLLKMVDVQSRVQKGMTLMHFVVRMCEKNHPEILELPMIVENISKAAGAYQAYDVDKNAVEKIQRDFQSELAECDEKDGPLKKVIESCTGEIAKALDELTRQFKQVEDGIGFFGEKPDDIPAFFGNWDKFFQSLQKTVKQSIQLKKKAEDAKKKEEQEKKKSEEKAMLGKFVSAVRDDDKSPAGAKGSSEDEKPGIRRPGSRAQKAGNTEKMLDDIMGSISMDDDDGPPKAAKKSPAPAKRLGDISPKPTTTRIDYKPGARRAVDKDKDKDKDKPKEEVKEEEKEDVWVPVGGPEVKPDVSPKVARSPAQTRAAARETDKQQLFSFLKEKEKKKTTGTGPQ